MGIFDRLGDVLKSYLNDEDDRLFGKRSQRTQGTQGSRYDDPDLQEAFEELDDFLEGKERKAGDFFREQAAQSGTGGASSGGGHASAGNTGRASSGGTGRASGRDVPESLRPDFAELGVSFGASADECKGAYKKLLKLHHPDRHAGHPGNMKKATEKSARINAAFDRIQKWRDTGRAD